RRSTPPATTSPFRSASIAPARVAATRTTCTCARTSARRRLSSRRSNQTERRIRSGAEAPRSGFSEARKLRGSVALLAEDRGDVGDRVRDAAREGREGEDDAKDDDPEDDAVLGHRLASLA